MESALFCMCADVPGAGSTRETVMRGSGGDLPLSVLSSCDIQWGGIIDM